MSLYVQLLLDFLLILKLGGNKGRERKLGAVFSFDGDQCLHALYCTFWTGRMVIRTKAGNMVPATESRGTLKEP